MYFVDISEKMCISSCLLGHPVFPAGLRPAFYPVTYSQHICVEGILQIDTLICRVERRAENPIPVFSRLLTFQIIFRNKTYNIMSTMRTRKLQN